MLWLNPGDNQGIRFLLSQIRAGDPWKDGPGLGPDHVHACRSPMLPNAKVDAGCKNGPAEGRVPLYSLLYGRASMALRGFA
jgi:hypothetical protein